MIRPNDEQVPLMERVIEMMQEQPEMEDVRCPFETMEWGCEEMMDDRRIWGLSFSEALRRTVDLKRRSLYVEGWAIFEKTSLPGFEGRVAEFEPMRALRVVFPNARFFRAKGPCDNNEQKARTQ